MPTGSPSGPAVLASATSAAPAMATPDQMRKAGPGRSPNRGTASTATTTGASVFINVTSTTDVRRSAVMNES